MTMKKPDKLGKGDQPRGTKGVKDLADKLAEDLKESNLDGASIIIDRIEQLKDLAVDGQVKQLGQLKDIMKNIMFILTTVPDKVDELATGDMAMCSSWYTPRVEIKLKDLLEECRDIDSTVAQIKPEPFQDLGQRMSKAMERITPTIKGMKNLPDEVSNVAEKAEEREDSLKGTDTKALKKSLESQDMNRSLSALADCTTELLDLVDPAQGNLQKVQTFLSEAHSRFKQAFDVPCPCSCMTRYVYDQPPRCMMDLLENADRALEIDLQPFADLLDGLKDDFNDLDTSKIEDVLQAGQREAQPVGQDCGWGKAISDLTLLSAAMMSCCLLPMGIIRRRR